MVAEFKKEHIMFGEIIIKLFIYSHKPSVHKYVDRSKISLGNYLYFCTKEDSKSAIPAV